MRDVCGDAPNEPRHQIELGDMLIWGDEPERAEALGLWTTISRNASRVTSTLRAEAFERLARAAAFRGDWDQVRSLIGLAVDLPLDASQRRNQRPTRAAIKHMPAPHLLEDRVDGKRIATHDLGLQIFDDRNRLCATMHTFAQADNTRIRCNLHP